MTVDTKAEAQELFNQALFGLRRQGVASMQKNEKNTTASCRYRTEDGRKCAAGFCITDEEYDVRIEGNTISAIIGDEDTRHQIPTRLHSHEALLSELQRAHDNYMPRREDECIGGDDPYYTLEGWEEQMKGVADRHGLVYIPLAQFYFDEVYTALKKQGCRATNAEGTCFYRAPNGTKCAFGHLLNDWEYTESMEGASVNYLKERKRLPRRFHSTSDLLHDLQTAHDSYMPRKLLEEYEDPHTWKLFMQDWHNQMHNIATRHGLEFKYGETFQAE